MAHGLSADMSFVQSGVFWVKLSPLEVCVATAAPEGGLHTVVQSPTVTSRVLSTTCFLDRKCAGGYVGGDTQGQGSFSQGDNEGAMSHRQQ